MNPTWFLFDSMRVVNEFSLSLPPQWSIRMNNKIAFMKGPKQCRVTS